MITQDQINKCYDDLKFIKISAEKIFDAGWVDTAYIYLEKQLANMTTHPGEILGYIKIDTSEYYDNYHNYTNTIDVVNEYLKMLEVMRK